MTKKSNARPARLQKYDCDGMHQNAVPEGLSQKDANWKLG
jgi:hypothetical protein